MSLQLAIKILETVPVQRGKQRLCSVIKDFFIHTTVLGKWNRNYMFQLQCLRNIRIILWNDPTDFWLEQLGLPLPAKNQ